MESDKQSTIQLYGTDSLCFNKNDFMKKDFNVDTFVQIHQASGSGGLETLRDDLGVYLKILRSAMIDLINRDYADFVNLSTNLTGLDRLIEALKTPLGQLREEVLSVECILSEAISSVSSDLARRHTINQQKALLHRINQISVRLDRLESLLKSRGGGSAIGNDDQGDNYSTGNDLVDRLATEVNHLNFLVAQCEGASLLHLFKPRVEAVCSFVEIGLERGLIEGIQGGDRQLLLRTLRTYASLGTIPHAHQHVRTILRSHLDEVISDFALKSDPRGLHGMFEKSLSAVKKVCDPLLNVSVGSGSDIVQGYSFLENSAWPEIVLALETRTQHIFNPGNPSVFHERYTQSMEFLDQFEKLLDSDERIVAFRKEADFQRFLDQWNLPVYFQIRYQEIGQVMESSLSDLNKGLSPLTKDKEFKLNSTNQVWESLVKCFDSEVFLLPLLHRFWKLCLLILSRHRTWIINTTATLKDTIRNSERKSITKVPLQIDQPSIKRSEEINQDSKVRNVEEIPSSIQNAVFLIHDIDVLAAKLEIVFPQVIQACVEHLSVDKMSLIQDTLHMQKTNHLSLKNALIEAIIDHLISSVSSPLKQVTDTPRIYRRTNKTLPTTHQPYMTNAILPLKKFHDISKEVITEEELKIIIGRVFSSVTVLYHNLTHEVLSSVHKMEESLRRLKRARDRGLQPGSDSSGVPSDDDKIRSQIHLDVLYFGDQVTSFGLDTQQIESYNHLFEMVLNAKEGKFVP